MSPFIFNASQKKGIFIFLLVLIGIILVRWGIINSQNEEARAYTSPFQQNDTLARIEPFDINKADTETWASLPGIGPVLSKRIISFRQSRNGFQSPEDLKKVYGLKPEVFKSIQPYLLVDSTTFKRKTRKSFARKYPQKTIPYKIDINTADTADFEQLPGIGKVLSARIIKYRNAKKGFQAVEDIKSVYGLKEEVFADLLPYLEVSEQNPQTIPDNQPKPRAKPSIIDINLADSAQWVQVPGIGKVMAPRIIKFKKLLGHFAEVDQLLLVYGFSEENLERARPFLKVGELSGFPLKNLNTAEWKHLVRYPFISKKLANDILALRKEKNQFSSWEEVGFVKGMKPAIIRQMRFYFEIKN